MSLEYELHLATGRGADEVLRSLLQVPGFERIDQDPEFLRASGVLVSNFTESPTSCQIIREAFGFEPSVGLMFRLVDDEDREQGVHGSLQATRALLSQMPGADAVLLFNGENTVLLKSQGRIYLNSAWDFWQPQRLALAPEPYTMKDFPLL